MASSDDRPQRRSGPAFQQVGDEGGLVVVPEASQVEVLNPVGAKVYRVAKKFALIMRDIINELLFLRPVGPCSLEDVNGPAGDEAVVFVQWCSDDQGVSIEGETRRPELASASESVDKEVPFASLFTTVGLSQPGAATEPGLLRRRPPRPD